MWKTKGFGIHILEGQVKLTISSGLKLQDIHKYLARLYRKKQTPNNLFWSKVRFPPLP